MKKLIIICMIFNVLGVIPVLFLFYRQKSRECAHVFVAGRRPFCACLIM
jgi:hypothetical protein